MDTTIKITFCWSLIIIGFIFHTQYELSGLFFGEDIKMPKADGEMPYSAHYFNILVHIIPLFFALLTLFFNNKIFKIVSLMYAGLLLLLNVFHLVATGAENIFNLSQMFLLTFITVVNILLTVSINKWRKII